MPVITFSAVLIFTPGPNNIMLTSSGAVFGFRKTLPHIFGVALGSPVLLFVIAIGGSHLIEHEFFRSVFQMVSIIYLLWLALKMATAKPPSTHRQSKPLSFLQAAAFQWINPKIWSQYLIAFGLYISIKEDLIAEVIAMAIVCATIGIVSACTWTMFGKFISKFLNNTKYFRIFNVTMALLLIVTILPILTTKFR